MRITIETTAPGIFQVTHEHAGQEKTWSMLSRFEVQIQVSHLIDKDNARNRVSDRDPFPDRLISIPVPSWLPWPKKRQQP